MTKTRIIFISAITVTIIALLIIATLPSAKGVTVATPPLTPVGLSRYDRTTTTTTTTLPPTTTTTAAPRIKRATATSVPSVIHAAAPQPQGDGQWPWDPLADCESGEWDRNRNPIPGSRNWADTRNGFQGGVHFAPSTWDDYVRKFFPNAGLPADANQASREQQIMVAEEVLKRQGWGAWPTCSYKIGAR